MNACTEWLDGYLRSVGHEVLADVVRAEAKKAGYTKAELKSARGELGVITVNDFEKGSGTHDWWWALP